MYHTAAVLRVFCQNLYFFGREVIMYMSVPDVMRESHNLNILSITVQNLHNVRVWFPDVIC